jgi:hypothetical protein
VMSPRAQPNEPSCGRCDRDSVVADAWPRRSTRVYPAPHAP